MIQRKNKTIGIVGGMGPMATVDLFHKIVAMTQSETDMGHLHILVDNNTNIPDRTAAILCGGPNPVPEMVRSALLLERDGADVLIMGCNTAHYFYPEIRQFVHIPFLNMIQETAKEIQRKGYCCAGLLATDGTVQSAVYAAEFERCNLELLVPVDQEQKAIMDMIYHGIKSNAVDWDTEMVVQTIENMKAKGAQAVVLGCTELPIAFSTYSIRCCLPVIDPTTILARQAILSVGGQIRPEYQEKSSVLL